MCIRDRYCLVTCPNSASDTTHAHHILMTLHGKKVAFLHGNGCVPCHIISQWYGLTLELKIYNLLFFRNAQFGHSFILLVLLCISDSTPLSTPTSVLCVIVSGRSECSQKFKILLSVNSLQHYTNTFNSTAPSYHVMFPILYYVWIIYENFPSMFFLI